MKSGEKLTALTMAFSKSSIDKLRPSRLLLGKYQLVKKCFDELGNHHTGIHDSPSYSRMGMVNERHQVSHLPGSKGFGQVRMTRFHVSQNQASPKSLPELTVQACVRSEHVLG